jgi:hypothetical protein
VENDPLYEWTKATIKDPAKNGYFQQVLGEYFRVESVPAVGSRPRSSAFEDDTLSQTVWRRSWAHMTHSHQAYPTGTNVIF